MSRIGNILTSLWVQILIIMIIDLLILPVLPWWGLVFPAFIFGGMYQGKVHAIVVAGTGSALAWGIMTLSRVQSGGDLIIRRVADMMGVFSPWILILITLFIPLMVGGLAGISGFFLIRRTPVTTE